MNLKNLHKFKGESNGKTLANLPKKQRASFTMIELVFVIVITGLVAVAGGKAIVQILQNYTLQKMYAKTEMDSASVIRQISNYLQNSVWDSIALNKTKSIAEISNHTSGALGGDTALYFIEKNTTALNGRYIDSNGAMVPYFSGFIDLENSSGNTIATQIQNDDLVDAYSKGGTDGIAIYFPFINVGVSTSVSDKYYQNYVRNNKAIFHIDNADNGNPNDPNARKTFTLGSAANPPQIGDIAMLVNAYPSYIRLVNAVGTTIDGKTYEKGDLIITRRNIETNGRSESTIIAKKVSNIHFWTESSASLIRVRVCFEAGVVKSIMEEFCKEGIIMQ